MIGIMKIRKLSDDAYALTGTPSPTKQHNIYGILVFLFPVLFSTHQKTINYYFLRYQNTYSSFGDSYFKIDGFKNKYKEREMQEFLETFSVQRKRKDVMKWIPEVDRQTIYLDMPPKMAKWHQELQEYFETEHIICQDALSVMLRQRQLTTSPLGLELPMKGPKFDWILEHIKDYPERPILIVGFFSSILEQLSSIIDKKHKLIIGKTSLKQREAHKDAFQNKEFNIIIGNISVMALGLNFSRAEEIIIIDPSLIEGENDQIKDRFIPTIKKEAINKEGQMITKLIVRDSVDMYLDKSLAKKAIRIDIINDYTRHLEKRLR